MPDGTLRRGAPARGPPKHQNKFAFKHNKNSKKTKQIQKIFHNGLCKRCHEKIEWRKKYRKYKPLTAPAHCNGCKQRTVKRAYHTLCESCAGGRGVCAKCAVKLSEDDKPKEGEENEGGDMDEEDIDMDDEEEEEAPKPKAVAAKPAAATSKTTVKSNAKDEDDDDEEEDDDEMLSDDDDDDEDDEDEE